MEWSDEELVANYLKGDEESLEVLIKRYLKPIYSFVYRYVGGQQCAEDATQDVFVKVWKNLKMFDYKKGMFKTWIFSIAKNTCIDALKKRKAVPLAETFVDPAPLPDEIFERNSIKETVDAAINRLAPKYRMVLFLRYNDHFAFREIAEALGEPINTIKSRHRRALIMLKKSLCY